jgi:prepilin-type N-terminal cleavage/methylation domain-containing protein
MPITSGTKFVKGIQSRRRRKGFTLMETIVTVGLISVMAAFVVPTVIQKAGAGDPVKVKNDLDAIRTAMEGFANDTKAGYPNQIWQLTSKPSTSNLLIDGVTPLSSGQVAAWNGPYLGATIGTASADSLATGYTAYIRNMIQRYDLDDNVGEVTGGTAGATFSATKTLFAAIRINGLNKAQAAVLNKSIDGGDDLDQADGSNTTGRFRWDKPAASAITVTAYYLAIPIVQ